MQECFNLNVVIILFWFDYTDIDVVVVVSDEEVAKYSRLMQVPQADHVLHPVLRGRVHRPDPPLRRQPLLFPVIVHHLPWKSQSRWCTGTS